MEEGGPPGPPEGGDWVEDGTEVEQERPRFAPPSPPEGGASEELRSAVDQKKPKFPPLGG